MTLFDFAPRAPGPLADRMRPRSLDEMARISGIGQRKLESYGEAFLQVISGEEPVRMHPARRGLAGREAAAIHDRLAEVQLDLARGEDGTGKPLSCSQSTLRQIAEQRPSTLAELARIPGMGDHKVDRFGAAFLAVIAGG